MQSDSLSPPAGNKWDIHLSYVCGYKYLDEDWIPARHHAGVGLIDFDFGRRTWPASIAAQLLFSYSPIIPRYQDIVGDYSGTGELNLGVRKVFQSGERIQPHVGAGVGIIWAATTTRLGGSAYYQEGNSSSTGVWVESGAYWAFSDDYFTGMSVHFSKANISLFNHQLNAGGIQLLFCFGKYW